jgi:hypothetical protein
MKAKAYRAAENTHSYFAALSRSAHLADWQFNQVSSRTAHPEMSRHQNS